MLKEKMYKYKGTNGTLVTPIELLGIDYTYHYRLTADEGKLLLSKSSQKTYQSVISTEADLANWEEIEGQEKSN